MPFFKRKSTPESAGKSAVNIFFCTDLHGSTVCFKKFINAAEFYGADVLIMGGDTTGKMIVPIIRRANGTYTGSFSGKDVELKTDDEVAAFIKRLTNMGFYPHKMDEDELAAYKDAPEKRNELFLQLIRERWEEWITYAEDKLKGTELRVFAAPGNDDFLEVDEMIASSDRFLMLEGKVCPLTDTHEILTTGWTNKTPWDTERELPEDELENRLEAMIAQVQHMERCIFNIHVPPHDSTIDICAKLDVDLRVVYDMGNPVQAPAGSIAVRNVIERYQPMLALHGHIHEGRGQARIGGTLCLNPGSVYSEGILNGVQVNISDTKVKGFHFTQG